MASKVDRQTREKMEKVIDLIKAKVISLGNVASREDMSKLYGADVIECAVSAGHFKTITLVLTDPTNARPPYRVRAIYNTSWTRERPSWA